MRKQPGFWSVEDRLDELSVQGDPLEKPLEIVDFDLFRTVLAETLYVGDRSKGGRPPFDAVLKFKKLYLQAQPGLSFEQTEHLVRDRLSWMRFCGLTIVDPVPDANTLWDFREALIGKGALALVFERLDQAVKDAGYLPMSGQIVDASLIAATRQRNTKDEKDAIKGGKSVGEIWPGEPSKSARKDTDARWTMKITQGKSRLTARCSLTSRSRRLREGLIDRINTASSVWADTAYRSRANEHLLLAVGKTSQIHRRKPKGKPMAKRTAKANANRSRVRARVEHVFAHQKDRMNLAVRSIGIKRAEATIIKAGLCPLERKRQNTWTIKRQERPALGGRPEIQRSVSVAPPPKSGLSDASTRQRSASLR